MLRPIFFRNNQKSFREKVSIFVAKRPARAIMIGIIIFNIVFFILATAIIAALAPTSLKQYGIWESAFYTIMMLIDPGSVSYVVEDVGHTGVAIIIACIFIVVIGMITFTGSIIGYVTNYIANFVEKSRDGKRPLNLSNHIVILNWNSRAAEAINDLLYNNTYEDIVILVSEDTELIQAEIHDRLLDTINHNNHKLHEYIRQQHMGRLHGYLYYRTHRMRNKLSVIIREGDVLSTIQLSNISIDSAKTILILGRDYQNSYIKYSAGDDEDNRRRGNSNLIKTLMLVTDMASTNESADHQEIIVEVEDEWTQDLVDKIIANKQRRDKCNVVSMPVNRFLGKLLSQLAIIPELNLIYNELFSNKGFFFESAEWNHSLEEEAVNRSFADFLTKYNRVLPLSVMNTGEGPMLFYLRNSDDNYEMAKSNYDFPSVSLNQNYWIRKKNVIILGHNSSMKYIMEGFDAFRAEWNYPDEREILDIVIVDDEASLEKNHNYEDYSYVTNVVSAEIFDKQIISDTIMDFYEKHTGDISILILSDDQVPNVEVDEQSLTYLIYIDDMLHKQKNKNPDFNIDDCDIVVEILNPQNFEAVRSYNSNHVVISNRYISHMMGQIGEHPGLYDFYRDILTYDSADGDQTKELYVKHVDRFFAEIPPECTAHQLIQAVYDAGPEDDKSILMGYITEKGKYTLFAGDNYDMKIKLKPSDMIILCSNH